MAAPDRVPVSRLREAVIARAAESSRRRVAAEIGLSHGGLRSFIEGARPHPATIEKLQRWYEREIVAEVDREAEALRVLLERIPPAHRKVAVIRTRAFLKALFEEYGGAPPNDDQIHRVTPQRMGE